MARKGEIALGGSRDEMRDVIAVCGVRATARWERNSRRGASSKRSAALRAAMVVSLAHAALRASRATAGPTANLTLRRCARNDRIISSDVGRP